MSKWARVLLLLLLPVGGFSAVYYVDGFNGNDGNTGNSWSQALRTIKQALSLCVDGTANTIYVTNSVIYDQNHEGTAGNDYVVRIAKSGASTFAPLKIVGVGNPVIECSNSAFVFSPYGFEIDGSSFVVLEGFVISNASWAGVFVDGESNKVVSLSIVALSNATNVYFTQNADYSEVSNCVLGGDDVAGSVGFFFYKTFSPRVYDTTVLAPEGAGLYQSDYGLISNLVMTNLSSQSFNMDMGYSVKIVDSTIEKMSFSRQPSYLEIDNTEFLKSFQIRANFSTASGVLFHQGISVADSTNFAFDQSQFVYLAVSNSTRLTVSNSSFSSSPTAVEVSGVSNVVFVSNYLLGGMSVSSAVDVEVENSFIFTSKSSDGLSLSSSTDVSVVLNTITNCDTGIVVDSSCSNVLVVKNNIVDNGDKGIDSGISIYATNNWWGSTHVSDISGFIGGSVNFVPYRLGNAFDINPGADADSPDVPSGLSVSYLGTQVVLSWSGVGAGDLAEYRIYRSTVDDFSNLDSSFIVGISTTTSFTDSPGLGRFYYRLTAVDSHTPLSNESWYSTSVSAFFTNVYYVDNVNGNDTNEGWSITNALKNIQTAIERLHDGQEGWVYVTNSGVAYTKANGGGGSSAVFEVSRSGENPGKVLTVEGIGASPPVIAPSSSVKAVALVGKEHIALRNFVVLSNGIQVSSSTDVVIENLLFDSLGDYAVDIDSGSRNLDLNGLILEEENYGVRIYGKGIKVRNSLFATNRSPCVAVIGGSGVYIDSDEFLFCTNDYAVKVRPFGSVMPKNVFIYNSSFSENTGGIYASLVSNLGVSNVVFADADDSEFFITNSQYISVIDSSFSNSSVGISAVDVHHLAAERVEAVSNSEFLNVKKSLSNKVENSSILYCDRGILFSGSKFLLVNSNQMLMNDTSVILDSVSNVSVVSNVFISNVSAVAVSNLSLTNIFKSSEFYDNTNALLIGGATAPADIYVKHSKFKGNNFALRADNAGNLVVFANSFEKNTVGVLVSVSYVSNISFNNFLSNSVGLTNSGITVLTSKNNWWGSTIISNIVSQMGGNIYYFPYRLGGPVDISEGADIYPPDWISSSSAHRSGSDVIVNWSQVSDPSFSFYRVYRSAEPSVSNLSPIKVIATINDSSVSVITDVNPPPSEVYYWITAVEIHGTFTNESWYSPRAEVEIWSVGIPRGITVKALRERGENEISWFDEGIATGEQYLIYRSTNKITNYQQIETSSTLLGVVSGGLDNYSFRDTYARFEEGVYYYAVFATLGGDTNTNVIVGENSSPDGTYNAWVELSNTYYSSFPVALEQDLVDQGVLDFSVISTNWEVAIDKFVVSVPTNLIDDSFISNISVFSDDGDMVFDPYKDNKIATGNTHIVSGTNYEFILPVSGSFVVPISNVHLWLTVTFMWNVPLDDEFMASVDVVPVENTVFVSGFPVKSSVISITDTVAPDSVSILNVREASHKVLAWWKPSPSPDVVRNVVVRSTNDGMFPSTISDGIIVAELDPSQTNFVETDLPNDETFYYGVFSVDEMSNASYGAYFQATPYLDLEPPNPPDYVEATVGRGKKGIYADIYWSPSPSWDVESYRVYRSNDGSSWKEFTNANILSLRDDTIKENTAYYYKVVAVDYSGNESEPVFSPVVYYKSVKADTFDVFNNAPRVLEGEQTRIVLNLSKSQNVVVKVIDIRGKEVKVINDGYLNSGYTELWWDGRDDGGEVVAPGVYFVVVKGESIEGVKKVYIVSF